MAWNPSEQFDHRQIFAGIAGAGQSLGTDLAAEKKKRELLEQQNSFNQMAFGTLSKATGPDGQPLLSEDEKQQFLKGNINAQNGIVTAAGARLVQTYQQKQQQDQIKKAKMEEQLTQNMLANSNKPITLQGANGQPYQAGVYDPRGNPHFLPYGGAANQFMPPEETMNAMKSSGYTYAPTSRGAGRWINTDGSKPDLGPDGNPQFTPDGTAFISGGKVKPLTQPMIEQRAEYQKRIEDAKKGPSIFSKEYWTGKKEEAAQPPSPAPTLTSKDQQALAWAQANPTDPRSAAILKKLGSQ